MSASIKKFTPLSISLSIVIINAPKDTKMLFAAVGSTLFLTTDFDVMTRASFLDRVITMQLDSKYRRNLDVCQSVIARKSP
jgi:hypothetical protein